MIIIRWHVNQTIIRCLTKDECTVLDIKSKILICTFKRYILHFTNEANLCKCQILVNTTNILLDAKQDSTKRKS